MSRHWTEESVDNFASRLSFDFITQLAKKMESLPLSQAEFAEILGVTEGRVSQILNNPGNPGLRKMVEYARALKLKVAVVAYDDNDPENERGPINPEVFLSCWEKLERPQDFFDLEDSPQQPVRGQVIYYDANLVAAALSSGNLLPNSFLTGEPFIGRTTSVAISGNTPLYTLDEPVVAYGGSPQTAVNSNELAEAA